MPSERPRVGRVSRTRSLLIPIGLLALCLVTATAFFLASAPRPSPRTPVADIGPTPSRGGVLRMPLDGPIWTLDPARAEMAPEISVIEQIYDGLTELDEQLNVVPALARYWEISNGGRVYTFELRPDARFHNGRPVTAEDCVYSFERLLTPSLNVANYHYFSRIEGAREFREGLAKHVGGLRAIDDRTFQIRFATPFVPALSVLSMYVSKILPKHELLAKGDEFFMAPVGTGPFRFSRWIGRDEDSTIPIYKGIPQAIRLEANRNYFGGEPFLDAVTFRYVQRLLDENFDLIPNIAENYLGWSSIEAEKLLAVDYFVLPNRIPPFDDARVRRALSYAMDKRSFLESRIRTTGAVPADSIVPPGIPGFLPAESTYRRNLKRAKELLAESGYPEGRGLPPLELLVYEQDSVSSRRRLESCLGDIGVELKEIKAKKWLPTEDRDLDGRAIFYESGWVADFPDPDNFLRPLFHSNSPANLSGYSNPMVDRMLDEAWTETSYSARNKLYHKIEKIILQDSPVIPLYHGTSRFLVRPNVSGLRISAMGLAYMKLNRVWFSEEETEPTVDY